MRSQATTGLNHHGEQGESACRISLLAARIRVVLFLSCFQCTVAMIPQAVEVFAESAKRAFYE
jgi:hypothetical protein